MHSNHTGSNHNYKEISAIVRGSYMSPQDINLLIEINDISKWIQSDEDKPLLIVSNEGGGKKTLVCELIKSLEESKPNYLVISQFASASPHYSEILYRICTQLRTNLLINQKVELKDEKLRQYFKYWLQIADKQIEKDYLTYSKQEKKQVIIVIEAINKITDDRNNLVSPLFWFPDVSLKNVKIIMTCDKETNIPESLMPVVSKKINFVLPENKIINFISLMKEKNNQLNCIEEGTHFGLMKIMFEIMASHPQMSLKGESKISFHQFLLQFIRFSRTFDTEQNICKMLSCLVYSKKGISINTIRHAAKVQLNSVAKLLTSFRPLIYKGDDTFIILGKTARNTLISIICEKLSLPEQSLKKQTHGAIAKALKKQNSSLNILEEMIYHLVLSENFIELKESLSRVENFVYLYTPETKHILCTCWYELENKFQYDPVFEYNKAVERFLSHYYPVAEDIFKIIFQLCLFFKEYSEYESEKTPEYRHPSNRGEPSQLTQISMFDELVQMGIFEKTKQKSKETKQSKDNKESESKCQPKDKDKESSEEESEGCICPKEASQNKEPKQVQKLNVKIKFHQTKFRELYLQEMEDYINCFYLLKKKSLSNQKDNVPNEESEDEDLELEESKVDPVKVKKSLLLKKYSDYCEETYNLQSDKRSFYYYKQWIWMQFPWISMSLNNNYSQLINQCMKSPTEYLPIELQNKLIREAIKVADVVKENKLNTSTQVNGATASVSKATGLNSKIPNLSQSRSTTKLKTNISRNKFDLSQLDGELSKTNRKQVKKRRKGNENKSMMFMTEIGDDNDENQTRNSSDLQQLRKLPHLKSASHGLLRPGRLTHSHPNVEESRQYGLLVQKYDEIKFQNEQLVIKIQELQQNRDALKGNSKGEQKESIKTAIEGLKEKKDKLLKSYKVQENFKNKLEMIIKLCELNKSHGSDSAHLNNFLISLKTMHKIEAANVQKIKEETKRVLNESKNEYKKLKEAKANEQMKLKKERARWNKSMSIVSQEVQVRKSKPKKVLLRNSSKENSNMDKLEETLRGLDEKFKELSVFGFISGDHQNNKKVLNTLQNKVDKLNEIRWKLGELTDENKAKEESIIQLQRSIQISKGNLEQQRELNCRTMQSQMQEQMQKAQERYNCLLKCMSIIDSGIDD